MGEVDKRLFIGNLCHDVSQQDLKEKFSRFGVVHNVQIKTRKNDMDDDMKTFAYLNLCADENGFKKCFSAYNNTLWKGKRLKLQYAKENFLNRLEEERKKQADESSENDSHPGKQGAASSPAFVDLSNRKAVPGMPVDEHGNWVVGKYGRVLPVLRVKNPKSGKVVTLDPSKTTHAVRKIKTDISENDSIQSGNLSELTWHMDIEDSEITKKRKGEFPKWEPLQKKRSLYSTIGPKENNVDKSSAEEEFEVVGISSRTGQSWKQGDISDGNDSVGSADTDEIVSRSFRKSKIHQASDKSTNKKLLKKDDKKHRKKKCDESVAGLSNCDSGTVQVRETSLLEMTMPRFVKGAKPLGKHVSSRPAQSTKTVASTLRDGVDVPVQMQQSVNQILIKDPRGGKQKNLVKTPEFRGLGMLSDSEETDSSIPVKDGHMKTKKQTSQKSVSQRFQTNKKNSPGEIDADPLSVEQDEFSQVSFKSPIFQFPHSQKTTTKIKPLNPETSHKKLEYTDSKLDSDASHSNETDDISPTSTNLTRNITKNASGKKFIHEEQFSLNEYGDGFTSKLKRVQEPYKRSGSGHFDSDDSDLDSNDFEVVAKKMAEIVHRQQKSGEIAPKKRQKSAGISSTNVVKSCNNLSETQSAAKKGSLELAPAVSIISQKSPLLSSSIDKNNSTPFTESHSGRAQEVDNQRRVEGIKNWMNEKNKQQNIIRQALQNMDKPASKKFSDSDEEDKATAPPVNRILQEQKHLFSSDETSDDEDADYMFRIRPQYEGDSGKELMALKSRYGGDSRFKLTESFMDIPEASDKAEVEEEAELKEKEKATSFRILEQVLGHKVKRRNPKDKAFVDMNTVRYIPGAENCKHLEVKEVNKEKRDLKKKVSKEKEKCRSAIQNEDVAKIQTERLASEDDCQKGQFFKVADNLKELLNHSTKEESQKETTFKLSQIWTDKYLNNDGSEDSADKEETSPISADEEKASPISADEEKASPISVDKEKASPISADEERASPINTDEEEDSPISADEEEASSFSAVTRLTALSRTSDAQDTFFFDFSDPRLEAGVKFFRRQNYEETVDKWTEQRPYLMELYKQRHKRFLRKASRDKRLTRRKGKK